MISPKEKYTAWIEEILNILKSKKVETDKMKYLLGNLDHAARIIPTGRYVLNQ